MRPRTFLSSLLTVVLALCLLACDSDSSPQTLGGPTATPDLPEYLGRGLLLNTRLGTVQVSAVTTNSLALEDSPKVAPNLLGGTLNSLRIAQPALLPAASYSMLKLDELTPITISLSTQPMTNYPTQVLILTPTQQLQGRNLGPGRYAVRLPDWQGGQGVLWYYFNIMGE